MGDEDFYGKTSFLGVVAKVDSWTDSDLCVADATGFYWL